MKKSYGYLEALKLYRIEITLIPETDSGNLGIMFY